MKKIYVLLVISTLFYSSTSHAWVWVLRGLSIANTGSKVTRVARVASTVSSASKVTNISKVTKVTNVSSTTVNKVTTGGLTNRVAIALTLGLADDSVASNNNISGLQELKEYPISGEINAAKNRGDSTYSIKVCKNNSGATYPIPHSLGRCPFTPDGRLYNGPVISLK